MIHFDISKLEKSLQELEQQTQQQEFWDDIANSTATLSKIKSIKTKIEKYHKIEQELQNLAELTELVEMENDEETAKDIIKSTHKLEKEIAKVELEALLSGKYDKNNAILTLHPGAGGTESQDWVEMLYRMYSKWASKNGYTLKEIDYLEGEEAGIKSVTFEII